MSNDTVRDAGRAADMRAAFDQAFVAAPQGDQATFDDFLTLRIEQDAYALRLAQVAGLFVDVRITRLPSDVSELLGVAAFRGTSVPVYDLRALLGYSRSETPRWMVVLQDLPRIALAFDSFEGHQRVARTATAEADSKSETTQLLRDAVRTQGVIRRIVDLPAVLESITERVRHVHPHKDE